MNKMTKMLGILVVTVATVAFAGGFKSYTYYQTDGASPPTPLSVGLPLDVAGANLKQITVTVSDFSDGGNLQTDITDDDFLRGFTLLAWRKVTAGQLATARDAGWTRQPELDVTYTASAAAIASSTNPASNKLASRSYSLSLQSPMAVKSTRCDGNADAGTAGVTTSYSTCVETVTVPGGALPMYPSGSQLRYQGAAGAVLGLDGGAKPFLITLDGVY